MLTDRKAGEAFRRVLQHAADRASVRWAACAGLLAFGAADDEVLETALACLEEALSSSEASTWWQLSRLLSAVLARSSDAAFLRRHRASLLLLQQAACQRSDCQALSQELADVLAQEPV